ncbi:hypothetical protein [Saccharothrix coeruleofusca]|uniref:Uncharacterized protein n=1 Tax=Saccharothrix coeruleofusca TaxID=33919 RepID=A0A918ANT9_9PSEU|nr:hypothetical protein [Saccharothrix coeruleofusca]MBP2338048.1 hypothetical protein [Saccharothrix coeruleofusca]GGP51093.1 hypothetical protein GCM10010185_24420 [Saccharothrix coeruleofusca]
MSYRDRDLRRADQPTAATRRVEPMEQREEVVERGDSRVRSVRVTCAVIDVVCWVFAVVLAVHIFLVVAGANPANGFARMIESWSAGVSLGLRDLFTPASATLRVLLNDGLAAVLWLVIGAVLTNLVTRVALPAGERHYWYRRRTVA